MVLVRRSDVEANAYYLKLLTQVEPAGTPGGGAGEVSAQQPQERHLLEQHPRHGGLHRGPGGVTSTASGEDKPDLTVEVWIDGKKQKEVKVTAENLFTFDNALHARRRCRRRPASTRSSCRSPARGPLYFNAYLTNFSPGRSTSRRPAWRSRSRRKFYKLTEQKDAKATVRGPAGQAVEQKVVKYDRHELANLDIVKSGDLGRDRARDRLARTTTSTSCSRT